MIDKLEFLSLDKITKNDFEIETIVLGRKTIKPEKKLVCGEKYTHCDCEVPI